MRGTGPLAGLSHGRSVLSASGRRVRRVRAAVALTMAATLVVTSVPTGAWAVPGPGMNREDTAVELPDLPQSPSVEADEGADASIDGTDVEPAEPYVPTKVEPWQQDTGVADLTGQQAGDEPIPVGDLPVRIGVPEGGDPAAVAGDWTIDLASPQMSQTAGVAGLIMRVTPPVTADPAGAVALTVDYTEFADLYGPQAADRFGIMVVPDCVYDTPGEGDCSPAPAGDETQAATAAEGATAPAGVELLPSEVEVVSTAGTAARSAFAEAVSERRQVTATVPLSKLLAAGNGSGGGGGMAARAVSAGSGTLAALDTGASAAGDYTATPLQSSGSWAAGSSSGAFTYAYQIQTPQTGGALGPKIVLSYSSQSVDGRTSSTNNQASWIGDGWDYSAGSITRTYTNCRQDSKRENLDGKEANNKEHRTGDLCWGSRNATLSLAGMTTELVFDRDESSPDPDKGTWHTANGDGSTIQIVKDTGRANGDKDGEYWIVTTRDGTRYYFGLNRLPGWSDKGTAAIGDDDETTDSVLTVPVYGNHPDEPCYQAKWADSMCYQGWRWSLDYVEDVHGNAMSLWWQREANYYAQNFNFKDPTRYHRGGHLKRIDYGQRAGSVFTARPLARVTFDVDERCFSKNGATCSEANFTSKNPGDYRIWYDTPADLRCADGEMCHSVAPSFFTRKRLDKITTWAQRTAAGDTTLTKVDEYQLKQQFPTTRMGANTALWLDSITRTGYDTGGVATPLNPVVFHPNTDDMPNRVRLVVNGKPDASPAFSRLRIAKVINEYGGETHVDYSQPVGDCATGETLPTKSQTAALKANTRLCYPVFWHPDPEVEEIAWFHKYVVIDVTELPNVANADNQVTHYQYANAGWKPADQEFTKKSTRTYSQFAGFELVRTITGWRPDPDDKIDGGSPSSDSTRTLTRYFRGMGETVTVTDLDDKAIAKDLEPFAGRIAEQATYTRATDIDSQWLSRSVTYPAAVELGHRDRAPDKIDPLRAWRVTEPRQVTFTKSSGDGDNPSRERRTETRTTFDTTYGLPTRIESLGDVDQTGDESCTTLDYLHHTGKHIIGLTRQVLVSPSTCADASFDDLTTLGAATRTAYDNLAYGTAPSTAAHRGLPTHTWSLNGEGNGFQADGSTSFDHIGRVTSRTDPDNKVSRISYIPDTGQAYQIVETNALGHQQIQDLDPARGLAFKVTDANNQVSQSKHDGLGRLIAAWGAGRSAVKGAEDFTATYTLPDLTADNPAPPYVTTTARGHENRIKTIVTIYDGLGRERQTQEPATGGGRLITETHYNQSGQIRQTRNAYLTEGNPSGALFTPLSDTRVPNATRYTYDGLGRVIQELPVLNGNAKPERAVNYSYGPDHSTVLNPAGAASYRLFTDALGRTTRVDTYTNANHTAYTTLRYSYDKRGNMVKATSSAAEKHPWTWTYDARGRQTGASDPDTGTTRTGYDSRDRVQTVTTSRGTVWNKYDELSRPTEQRIGGSDGQLLATFKYDAAANGKGLPYSATRYTGADIYTQTIGGYTSDYQPTSTTLTLPDTVVSTWGLAKNYTYSYNYTDTGLPQSVTLPAVGSLPSENLLIRYSTDGLPLSVSGNGWYGAETVYSPYGQVLRSTMGSHGYRVWALSYFDDASGELTKQQVFREKGMESAPVANARLVADTQVSDLTYTYDPAGNVTSKREAVPGIDERQCFSYDTVGRLTQAWTAAKQKDPCATTPTSADVSAGSKDDGYWQQYDYDLIGNRTQLVEKNLSGDTSLDATTNYTYGHTDPDTKTVVQPRTLTSTKRTSSYLKTATDGTQSRVSVVNEAQRVYDATGSTTSVESLTTGDKQELGWTVDGKIERVTGQGSNRKTAYIGPRGECFDLKSGYPSAGQGVLSWTCNGGLNQKWTFTPETKTSSQTRSDIGRLSVYDDWCLQPAANTAGAALQVQKCAPGRAEQLFTRTTAGLLVHNTSGLCVAGPTANTAVVLKTCNSSDSVQQWLPQNETSYVYGPGGNRLLTIEGRQATLHLGEADLKVQAGGTLVKATRTYGTPGGSVTRAVFATGAAALVAVTSDHQGSPYAEIALTGAMDVRIRKQDPFGNQRGAGSTGPFWQTNIGFLGAARDDSTGFVHLGARLYDATVGRFLSADPVLDLTDPQQANGYTYAHNNPVTHSDPTGTNITLTDSEMAAALAGVGLSPSQVADAQAMMNRSLTSVILSAAWGLLSEIIGLNDAISCFGGDLWACGGLLMDIVPWGKIFKAPRIAEAIWATVKAVEAFRAAKKAAEAVMRVARAAETAAINAKRVALERAKAAAQALKKKPTLKVEPTSSKAVTATKKTGSGIQKQAQGKANPAASTGNGRSSYVGKSNSGANRSNGGSSGGCNSFLPGTKVGLRS